MLGFVHISPWTWGYTVWWEYRAQWWRDKGCLFPVWTLSCASLWPAPLGFSTRSVGCFIECILRWDRSWLGSPQLPSANSLLMWTCSSWSPGGLFIPHPSAGVSSCFSFGQALLALSLSLNTRAHLGFELLGLIKFKALSLTLPCLGKPSALLLFTL